MQDVVLWCICNFFLIKKIFFWKNKTRGWCESNVVKCCPGTQYACDISMDDRKARGSPLSLCVLTDPGASVGGLKAWCAPGICESQSMFSTVVVSWSVALTLRPLFCDYTVPEDSRRQVSPEPVDKEAAVERCPSASRRLQRGCQADGGRWMHPT